MVRSAFRVERLTLRQEQLREALLPRLMGMVFHVTSRTSYRGIRKDKAILNNRDRRFAYTFPQSEGNSGRERGWVSVFDLRNVPEGELDAALDKFPVLDPFHRRPDTPVFLVLDEAFHAELKPWTEGAIGRRIPYVEAWYPGDIALNKIRLVLDVKVQRPPESDYEQILREVWARRRSN
jgi:hypothetical protein